MQPLMIDGCHVTEVAHTAEVGLRARAETPETLFACLAHAMFLLTGARTNDNFPGREHTVTIRADDVESLLVDWLSELLYLHEVTGDVFTACEITRWAPTELSGIAVGRPSTTPFTTHIKAVTYHDLSVQHDEDGWLAQVVFDI